MNKDQQNVIDNQEDLTEVLRVRREKLSKLQEMEEIHLYKVDMIELIILWT